MKNVVMIFALVLGTISLQAQTVFGIKAGLSTSDIGGKDFVQDDLTLKLKNADYGMHFGVFLRAQKNRFFIQPEATLNSLNATYALEDINATEVFSERYTNLDVPILLGLKLGPLRLGAGPVGHFNIGKSSNLDGDGSVVSNNYEEFTVGYQAGLGLDIWKLNFDLRYEGNFNEFGNHIQIGGNSANLNENSNRMTFSVGWAF